MDIWSQVYEVLDNCDREADYKSAILRGDWMQAHAYLLEIACSVVNESVMQIRAARREAEALQQETKLLAKRLDSLEAKI